MKEILEKAALQLEAKLPFVVYRQPKSTRLQAFFMKDASSISVDFNQAGFCFFPFDDTQKNYFFPLLNADYFSTQIVKNDINTLFNESDTSLKETLENETEKRSYIQLLAESIHFLKQGDYQKIVLSRPIRFPYKAQNAMQTFQRLLYCYKEAMVYIWYHPKEGIWMGASPETLVQYRSSQLKTMALAGTRKFQEKEDVLWQEKEKEEQELVSQYIQKKLSAYTSHLKISETYNKQAGNLVHLNTDISARIQPSALKKVILDLHPTPAVCGLPTEKAKRYILENEAYDREFYAGFLGEINLPKERNRATSKRNQEALAIKHRTNETHLYVNLRCMKIENDTGQLFVGGGVTAASNPTDEWIETREKSQTLLNVL